MNCYEKEIILINKSNEYLIVKENNEWNFPEYKQDDDIIDNIKRDFGINIEYVSEIVIDENIICKKYCCTDEKKSLDNKFKFQIISELYFKNILSNVNHIKVVEKLYFDISLQIFKDALWLGILSKIVNKIDNYWKKQQIVSFIVFFSSIFCGEVIICGAGKISNKRNVTLKEIKQRRNRNLKDIPNMNSKEVSDILKEMGINYSEYTFDCVLHFINDELVDINSRTCGINKQENFELLDGAYNTPYRWVENLLPNIDDSFWDIFITMLQEPIKEINQLKVEYRTYSTYKMFKNNDINNYEKTYILQRYGLIKSVLFIDKIFKNNINNEKLKESYNDFMRKIKSTIIEMIWNDSGLDELKILKKVFNLNNTAIPETFYPINRKCRDNIHYSEYNQLTNKETECLDMYQDVYLNNIIKVLSSNITYKFDIWYYISLTLAKIYTWSNSKKD